MEEEIKPEKSPEVKIAQFITKHNDYIVPTEQETDSEELYSYQITEKEFDDDDGNGKETLNFFIEGLMADTNFMPIGSEEIEDLIGIELYETIKNTFENNVSDDTDSIYIRNEKYHCDYEIVFNNETYDDLIERRPELFGD